MMILLTSGNPLGLRALGSGGRTASASFEQITRTLRQGLGAEHAALFAEPSQRAGQIDWFGDAPAGTVPLRLLDAPPEALGLALVRLERLVRDIEAKALAFQKSDRQDERILGEMLVQALDIPEEGSVFLLGAQPVMTFWGFVRDKDRPAVSPLQSLLARRAGLGLAGAGAPDPAVAVPVPARRGSLVPALLWTLLALFVLVCAAELLRGCVVRLPAGLSSLLGAACTASAGTGALDDERARQAALQAELDGLSRDAASKRQACQAAPGRNDTPAFTPKPPITPKPPGPTQAGTPNALPEPKTGAPPALAQNGGTDAPPGQPAGATPPPQGQPKVPPAVPPPAVVPPGTPPAAKADAPPPDQLKIPPKASKSIAFLEGCWRAHEGLTENHEGKQTGKELKVTYCFDKNGVGARTIRYVEDNAKCVGPIKADLTGDTLTMNIEASPCDPPHGEFNAATDRCKPGEDGGAARCDEVQKDGNTTNFSDFPFTRTTEQP